MSSVRGTTGEHSVPVFEHVVVGVDRREGGRDAIALAARLISEGARLTLAHVYRGEVSAWRGAVPPFEPTERRQAEQELQTAAREAGVVAEVTCHGASSVGRGLHELAELAAADLLIVGSSRRGVVGRVLLGDDTRASLNGAPCAIAIAPAGFAHHPRPIASIGVAYNESPESKHALSVGRTLASEHNAKLLALEAISIPAYALGTGLIPMPVDDCMQSLLEGARDRLSGLDGVETQAVSGPAAEALASFSSSVDLLIVGSRGYGPLGRLVHGSTSRRLAHSVGCPLLVLPRAAHVATTGGSDGEDAAQRDAGTGDGLSRSGLDAVHSLSPSAAATPSSSERDPARTWSRR